ncbi:methionyl-tRNA synthetase [Parcubacteria bacterium DG_74_3]|nr:MAG: methionyl-tRNA synthetase [Parcubacteria bacterium DG_74_3]
MISFQEFQKMDLQIGKVIEVKGVEGAENLLKLKVDFGEKPSKSSGREIRQIIAGIAKFYKAEDLLGKDIVVIVNLEPKRVFGLESQGMLLAADVEGEPILLLPDKKVPPGTKIR